MRVITERVDRVLRAIPFNKWVNAAEISSETGIDSYKVSGIIRKYLLFAYVEGKCTREHKRRLYRRLNLIKEEKQ